MIVLKVAALVAWIAIVILFAMSGSGPDAPA